MGNTATTTAIPAATVHVDANQVGIRHGSEAAVSISRADPDSTITGISPHHTTSGVGTASTAKVTIHHLCRRPPEGLGQPED